MRKYLLGIVFLLAMSLPAAANPLPVSVSIVPQKYFVERIGGELVEVNVMVEPGASPATYEPKPRQMAHLADSRIFFAIGVPWESAWLARMASSAPDTEFVHTEHGIQRLPMQAKHDHGGHVTAGGHEAHPPHGVREAHGSEDHHAPAAEHHGEMIHLGEHEADDHAHGHGDAHHESGHAVEEGHHDHDHAGMLDPHIWTTPLLVKEQARTIAAALMKADPVHAAMYEKNLTAFLGEIDELHRELSAVFASVGEANRFIVFHPSWGYFARSYGLVQIPVEMEGKEPGPRQLGALISEAREEGARVVFVQPQFSDRSAKLIAAEIRGEVVKVDPLAYSWAENLRSVADAFVKSLH